MSEHTSTTTNLAVLRGTIHGDSTTRELPSGAVVMQFDIATASGSERASRTVTVPIALSDPSVADAALVVNGAEVVVIGAVQRRFFRVGGATQSRTEVVASRVIPTRRRKQVAIALEAAAAVVRDW